MTELEELELEEQQAFWRRAAEAGIKAEHIIGANDALMNEIAYLLHAKAQLVHICGQAGTYDRRDGCESCSELRRAELHATRPSPTTPAPGWNAGNCT